MKKKTSRPFVSVSHCAKGEKAMARRISTQEYNAFRYQTDKGENGEKLYHMPMEIEDEADLNNYGITWNDCKTINFGGTDQRTVYFYMTPNRELAEEQWRYLNREHIARVNITRCMIPGERKIYKRCPTACSCARCPYGKTAADKQLNLVSWDQIKDETGDRIINKDNGGNPVAEQAEYHLLIEELQEELDSFDPRLMDVLRMRLFIGYNTAEIALQLGCSRTRVYQLLEQAKRLARAFLAD